VGRKYLAKVDGNQAAITGALRQAGCLVQTTHTIGRGFPDLLVSHRGVLALLEVKVPGGKLTPDEVQWHAKWQDAPVYVITGVEEIPALLQTIEGDAT
jgi:hypothetical protein